MIPSILSTVVLALVATNLAAAVGGPSVDPLGHGTALKARTNAEAIQKGQPLLKPRMVPSRVDHNYNRKRASPVLRSEVVDFDDITTGSGGYGTLLGEYQGKLWTALGPEQQAASNAIYQAAAITFFPAASSPNWLFTNPGPAYFTGYGSRKPIVSSLDGRATLRLRSLTCGKADPVQDDATMSVVGSIAGEPTFAVELDCPKGAAAKVNALGNLPAVDRITFISNNGFAGMLDDLVFLTLS